jgi:hypothetical protein
MGRFGTTFKVAASNSGSAPEKGAKAKIGRSKTINP